MLRKFKCLIANGLDALVKFVYFRPVCFSWEYCKHRTLFRPIFLTKRFHKMILSYCNFSHKKCIFVGT